MMSGDERFTFRLSPLGNVNTLRMCNFKPVRIAGQRGLFVV